jgi:bifunctional polynucleotide phosphatase/kinase
MTTKSYMSEWREHGTLTARVPVAWTRTPKIVAFDLDSTLVVTKSGKVYARDAADWRWAYEFVPDVLRHAADSGYGVVLVTNQLGAAHGTPRGDTAERRIEAVLETAGVADRAVALVATSSDTYRKPCAGAWEWFLAEVNGPVSADECAFIGDAAGRANDFSDCDRKFALNIGIRFFTPEELFLGAAPETYALGGWHPSAAMRVEHASVEGRAGEASAIISASKPPGAELLVLVGRPGSGKSTFSQELGQLGYVRVCQDELGTKARCVKAVKDLLSRRVCVVLDATNSSPRTRAEWIALARQQRASVRALLIDVSREQAWHMNLFREAQSGGARRRVPDIAYAVFEKGYVEPAVEEGFDEVLRVAPELRFESERDAALFARWYS